MHERTKNNLYKSVPIAAFMAVILAFSTAHSADIEQISQKLRQGDFSVVKSELIPLAESGNPRAQFNLGVSYALGHGVKKDMQKSHEWTLKAAHNGERRAQVNLASMYFEGRGVKRDVKESIKWYKLAADAEDLNACLALGRMYRDGIPGKVDYDKAFKYFSIAAEKGDYEARYNLAGFYRYGLGVEKDENKSKELFASLPGPAYNMPTTYASFKTELSQKPAKN